MQIKNKRIPDDEFFWEREEVLAEWPTGKEVDLNEAVEYQKNLPASKRWSTKLDEAKEKGTTYMHSGMGHATLEQETELLKYIQDNGPAELLEMSVDSLSRVHDFKKAERGIKESEMTGKSVLNGFPPVNYGVAGVRKLTESLNIPIRSAYASTDPRLIHEILYAGGVTGNSGGMLSFWMYNSRTPVDVVLHNYQYIWKLTGYYTEKGALISDLAYGGTGGFYTPPSLGIAGNILQSLIMAEQGIKHLALTWYAQYNMFQDVAAGMTIRKLAREYLDKFGYNDMPLYTETFLCGRYPTNIVEAYPIVCCHAILAKLCGAEACYCRTIAEARAIAVKEEIAATYRCHNMMINLLKNQKIELDHKVVDAEAEMCEKETRAIVDRVIDLGDGDVVIGYIRAVESGVLDTSFASCPFAACKVMGVRDLYGAFRWLDHGNLPFDRDIVEFHKGKLAERSKRQGREVGWEDIITEVLTMGTGHVEVAERPFK